MKWMPAYASMTELSRIVVSLRWYDNVLTISILVNHRLELAVLHKFTKLGVATDGLLIDKDLRNGALASRVSQPFSLGIVFSDVDLREKDLLIFK